MTSGSLYLFVLFWITVVCPSVYAVTCGQSITPSVISGSISSPNYPYAYVNNLNCEWHINAAPGVKIRITFQSPFTLEPTYDLVRIYDAVSGNQMIVWDGTSVPQAYITDKNQLNITFTSDHSNVYAGFKLQWEKINYCGDFFLDDAGNLTSPTAGGLYKTNRICEWTINGTEDKIIHLKFHPEFDIEMSNDGNCSYDSVEIFDTTQSGGLASLGRFCGTKTPPAIVASSNSVVIRFRSDNDKAGKGFSLSWDTYCGRVIQASEGIVSSPHYPQPYPHEADCRWEIRVHTGYVIRLNFQSPFNIEGHVTCDTDYLELYEYSTSDGDPVMKDRLCGDVLPQEHVSTSSRMLMVFHSDDYKTYSGFQAVWDSVLAPGTECSRTFTSSNGSLSSPGFPEPYPNNLNCRWEITVTPGQLVKLVFGSIFNLETDPSGICDDQVEVLDVLSNGTVESKGKWCSGMAMGVLYSTSSHMLVLFTSDADKSGLGFTATWETASGCSFTSENVIGHLASPNFPDDYHKSQVCRWEVAPPVGTNVTLHFDALFDIEISNGCAWDYLQMRLDNTTLGRWCGNDAPPKVSVEGGQRLELFFNSDKSNVGKGFYASWTNENAAD